MADYHEERTLTEGFRKGENKDKNDCHKTTRTTRESLEEMMEKRFWIETQNKFVKYIVCTKLLRDLYIKRPALPHLICSLLNSGVSLCFVNARLSFYYFKILKNFTCKRIRANFGLIYYLCG